MNPLFEPITISWRWRLIPIAIAGLLYGYVYIDAHGGWSGLMDRPSQMATTASASTTTVENDQAPESSTAELEKEPSPPPQHRPVISIDNNRSIIWLSNNEPDNKRRYLRWNPVNGETREIDLTALPELSANTTHVVSIIEINDGVMLFARQFKPSNNEPKQEIIALVTPQNKIYTLKRTAGHFAHHTQGLRDGSVLVAGTNGAYADDDEKVPFTNTVERFRFNGESIEVEQLPEIPGNYRRGISWVELSDNRVMALGGSSSQYTGSTPISSETYLLDLATKSWQPGPRMNKARSGATATLLPDNTVLVAGGWTPEDGWNDAPTRTTERWDTHALEFVADQLLPIGVANHNAQWIQTTQGKQLVLSGGWIAAWRGNQQVLALNPNKMVWHSVADECSADNKEARLQSSSFEHAGRAYMWCKTSDAPWKLVSLRLSTEPPVSIAQAANANGTALHRYGIAFLPSAGDLPALAIGGMVEGADSAIVDALWLDGRIQSLAPLNHARRNAQAFRLSDGSILVFGGAAGNSPRRTLHVPPPELLPFNPALDKSHWVDIELEAEGLVSLGMLKDGGLLAVHSSGEVERLTIAVSPEKISVQRTPFPSLNRTRIESDNGYSAGVVIRELADGRIIVAGGSTQHHRMALMHDDVDKHNAIDHFTYLGEFTPSHNYDIYDPKTRHWNASATSDTDCAVPTILDDGRVVKWGSNSSVDPWSYTVGISSHSDIGAALEISSSDGMTWSALKEDAPPLVVTNVTHHPAVPFVIDGELFLSGTRPTDVTEHYWRGNQMVLWYNSANARWETLWEDEYADKGYRVNLGRIIIRDLPNGKRIVLPISGISPIARGG